MWHRVHVVKVEEVNYFHFLLPSCHRFTGVYWSFFWTFSIHLLIGRLNPTNCLKNLVYLDIRRLEKAVNAGCSQVLAILVKIGENLIATFIIDTLCDQVNMLGFV